MQKVIKAAMCRYASTNRISSTVGVVQASFHIKGTFENYVKLIDDIYSFDHRAMMTPQVSYPRTTSEITDEDSKNALVQDETGYVHTAAESSENSEIVVENDTPIEQDITLIFLCVEPMDALETVDVTGTPDKADDIVVNQRPAVY